jgi:GxxExxY protein
VYQEALAMEMNLQEIPFLEQVELPVFYKDTRLGTSYRPDFICYDGIILEIKALSQITTVETSQLINYLKASNYQIGLLLNFGAPSLQYKRYIYTNNPSKTYLPDPEPG